MTTATVVRAAATSPARRWAGRNRVHVCSLGTSRVDALLDGWCATVSSAGGTAGPPAREAAGRDLLRRWSELHRHYHNREHLAAVLDTVDTFAAAAEDADAVRLGAWFHDAIYDPRRGDNEEASALLAASVLAELGVGEDIVTEVTRLVRLTAAHEPEPDDRNGALLCDADLAILAAPPSRYRRYTEAVRREYAHVPDELFVAGRTEILGMLLGRPTLYRLPELGRKWEKRARINLAMEVSALTAAASRGNPLDS